MAFPRITHILAGAIVAFGSALWLNAIAPLAGLIAASWGAVTIIHAFAVAVAAVLAMLVTAAGALLAADWRADVQSRQTWAQLGPTAVEWSLPVGAAAPWEIDMRYLPVVDNEALRHISRAHRFASAEPVLQVITEVLDTSPEITCTQAINAGAVSELGASDRALRKFASTVCAAASNAVASRRGPPLARRVGRAAPQTRLAANANAGSGWPARDECILTRTLPGSQTADIIVLGSSRDDRTQPFPDGSVGGNIARSAEPPNCRGPPQVVRHRTRATETTPAKLSVDSAPHLLTAGALPTADPVVRDNLGQQVPVCTAELDVIETYLDHVLRDLLASSTGGSEPGEA
jgi:hypothetical protein